MKGKYCGDCYDIYPTQSQYTKVAEVARPSAAPPLLSIVVSFVLALNRVNVVAVTTILALHVGNAGSEHV